MKKLKSIIIFLILFPLHSFSQDYWEHVYTTDTNQIMSMKVANDGTIYFGGAKGLFISHDDGQTWDFKHLLNYIWIYSLEFDQDSNLLVGASYKLYKYDIENDTFQYLETPQSIANFISIFVDSTGIYLNGDDNRILRYKNEEWSTLDLGNDAGLVFTIVKDTNGVLYAGTTGYDYGGGVFRSFNDGDTWEYFGLHHYYVKSLAIDSHNRLYAGATGHVTTGEGGFFRYNYETQSWDTLSHNARVQSMYFNEEDSLYAGIYSNGANAGAWMSPDYGDTWVNISSGLPTTTNNNVKDITSRPDGYLYAIVGYDKSIYKSSDPTIVNIKKNQYIDEINLYPNPISKYIWLEFDGKRTNEKITILIYGLNGNLLFKQNATLSNANYCLNIGNEIQPGIYMIKVNSERGTFSKKIIKY